MNILVIYGSMKSFAAAEKWIEDALEDWSEGEFDPREDLYTSFTKSIYGDDDELSFMITGMPSIVDENIRVSVDVTGNGDIMEFDLPTEGVKQVEISGFSKPRRARRRKKR